MLFLDEAPLTGPVKGNAGYAEWFAAQGPRDGKGRSLRDFDLTRRLFKYPCSYLIYSEAFDALPPTAKRPSTRACGTCCPARRRRRAGSARCRAAERQAIIEILRETKRDLPASFR